MQKSVAGELGNLIYSYQFFMLWNYSLCTLYWTDFSLGCYKPFQWY